MHVKIAKSMVFCAGCLAWTAVTAWLTRDRPASDQVHAVVDHVILGVSDRDRGCQEFETLTGVRPRPGGRHPGAGTRNALVSLGDRTYLEIMAPDPEAASESSRNRLGTFAKLTPFGWAIGTTNIGQAAARLRDAGYEARPPSRGSRVQPDGAVLRWTSLSVGLPDTRHSPFFIEWDRDTPHPASTSPPGCRLEAIVIQEPEPSALAALVKQFGLDVSVLRGDPAMRIALRCPKGRVVIGS
jgi:hypothetical protein